MSTPKPQRICFATGLLLSDHGVVDCITSRVRHQGMTIGTNAYGSSNRPILLFIDEPYKPGGRPFAAGQGSPEPRAATVPEIICGVLHAAREDADELSRQ